MQHPNIRRRLVSGALLVIAGACASGPTASSEPITTVDQAEARWKQVGYSSYRFVSDLQCFCAGGKARVDVLRGSVVRVVSLSTGADASVRFRLPIDSLFTFVRREQLRLPQRLRVTWDQTLGYPRTIEYGTRENDAGGVIGVEDVRPLP